MNTSSPNEMALGLALITVNDFRLLHPAKAWLPIVDTYIGSSTSVSEMSFMKA